jgi:hypothetical protein
MHEFSRTVSRSFPPRICKKPLYADVPFAQTRTACSGFAHLLAHHLAAIGSRVRQEEEQPEEEGAMTSLVHSWFPPLALMK